MMSKLDEPTGLYEIGNDDAALELLECVIGQARDDYYLDIVRLANKKMPGLARILAWLDYVIGQCNQIRQRLTALSKERAEWEAVLEQSTSRESDLAEARKELAALGAKEAELTTRYKCRARIRRTLDECVKAVHDIRSIEAWTDHDPAIIRKWRACALKEYLEDLGADDEEIDEAIKEMEDSDAELWITFAEIREKINKGHRRKKRRSSSCRFRLQK